MSQRSKTDGNTYVISIVDIKEDADDSVDCPYMAQPLRQFPHTTYFWSESRRFQSCANSNTNFVSGH